MNDDVAEASSGAYRERFLYEKSGNTKPIVVEAEVIDEHQDSDGAKSEGVEVEDQD